MNTPSTHFPVITLPSTWGGLIPRTKEGYAVAVTDARAVKSKDLKFSPTSPDNPEASLFEFRRNGVPVVICNRAEYEKLRSVLA